MSKKRARGESGREVLLEFVYQGGYVRVAALDPATATEVVMVGDAYSSKAELTRLAVRKLEYVLAKKAGGVGWCGSVVGVAALEAAIESSLDASSKYMPAKKKG